MIFQIEKGRIFGNLPVGADVAGAVPLRAAQGFSSREVTQFGSGFIVTPTKARMLGLGTVLDLKDCIREYRHGCNLTVVPRGGMAIDLYGLDEIDVRNWYLKIQQHLLDRVKPEHDEKSSQENKRQLVDLWSAAQRNTAYFERNCRFYCDC